MSNLVLDWGQIYANSSNTYLPIASSTLTQGTITLNTTIAQNPTTLTITNVPLLTENNTIQNHTLSYTVKDINRTSNTTTFTITYPHNIATTYTNNTLQETFEEYYRFCLGPNYDFAKTLRHHLQQIYNCITYLVDGTTINCVPIPTNSTFYANATTNPQNYQNHIFFLSFELQDVDFTQIIPTMITSILTQQNTLTPILFYSNNCLPTSSFIQYTPTMIPNIIKTQTTQTLLPNRVILGDYVITNSAISASSPRICKINNNLVIPHIVVAANNNICFTSNNIVRNLAVPIYSVIYNKNNKLQIYTKNRIGIKPGVVIQYNNELYFINRVYLKIDNTIKNIVIEGHKITPVNINNITVEKIDTHIGIKAENISTTLDRKYIYTPITPTFVDYTNEVYRNIIDLSKQSVIKAKYQSNMIELKDNTLTLNNSNEYCLNTIQNCYTHSTANAYCTDLASCVSNNTVTGAVINFEVDNNNITTLLTTYCNNLKTVLPFSSNVVLGGGYLQFNNTTPVPIGTNLFSIDTLLRDGALNNNDICVQTGVCITNFCLNCLCIPNVTGTVRALVISGEIYLSRDIYHPVVVINNNTTVFTQGFNIYADRLYIGQNVWIRSSNSIRWRDRTFWLICCAACYTTLTNTSCTYVFNFISHINSEGIRVLNMNGDFIRMAGNNIGVISGCSDTRSPIYLNYIPHMLQLLSPELTPFYTILPPQTYVANISTNSSTCISLTFCGLVFSPPIKLIAREIIAHPNGFNIDIFNNHSGSSIGFAYFSIYCNASSVCFAIYGQPSIKVNNNYYGTPALVVIATEKINKLPNICCYTPTSCICCDTTFNLSGCSTFSAYLINSRTTQCTLCCVPTLNYVPQFTYFLKL